MRKEKHVNGKETIIIRHNERAGNGENVSSSLLTGVVFGTMIGNVCYADDLNTVMKNIKDIVETLFKSIGFVLVLWGAGQLVLAFKNEDPDSKSRAIMSIVAGVALYGFASLTKQLGLDAPSFK